MVPALRVYGPRGGYHLSTMTRQVPLRDVTKRGPQPSLASWRKRESMKPYEAKIPMGDRRNGSDNT